MQPLQVAQLYFDAWNRHDGDGVVALFAEGGTYNDPASGGDRTGEQIKAYAQDLWTALPDVSFELVSAAVSGDGLLAAQWIMRGVNNGPFAGLPPSGRSVTLPGADFIRVESDKIRSVQGYFDTRAFSEHLGLQVL